MNSTQQTIGADVSQEAVRLASEAKLFGRTAEITQLLAALDRIALGRGEVMLLPGLSGSGKTALANALRGPTGGRNGLFIEGKFNQYDQNVAFVAWRQALSEFCSIACSEEKSIREKWAEKIRSAVGQNGQLLVELAPQFEELLGIQSPVDAISPQESRHRFAGTIRDTLEVVCQPEHPLVVFIDDWQWADPASLDLFAQLQVDSKLRYLLLITAYRSDEVNDTHGFVTSLNELRSQQVPIETIQVNNLSRIEIESLVADAVAPSAGDAQALADAIHRSSQGNAFFAHALVERALAADATNTSITELDDDQAPNNIVELFSQRIDTLTSNAQELLTLAACLGNRFDADTLSAISGRSQDDCLTELAAANGLVEPICAAGILPNEVEDTNQRFQFVHDRVQQAAYSRISNEEMPQRRLEIARKMLAHLSAGQLKERVCEVTEHLNAGSSVIQDSEERLRSVELNVAAARKNRASTAYRSALECHRAALRVLNSGSLIERLWTERHNLAMALYLEHAETEFLEGDTTRAEELIRCAVAKARTPIEKANALSALIVQNTVRARYADAISAGREALEALGTVLPEDNFEAARDAEIDEIRHRMEGLSAADIVSMPVATDETVQVAARVLVTLGPPCYRAHQRLWSVLVPRVVNLTLRHGHIPQIGYSHTAFAGLLGWVSNDYASGQDFCEIASQLMSGSLGSSSDRSVFYLMIGSSGRHWYAHLSESSRDYQAAIQSGRESGNLQYAAYAYGHNMYCRYFQGIRLDELLADTKSSLEFSRTRHNQWAVDLLTGGLSIIDELSGERGGSKHTSNWESGYLRDVDSHHNQQVSCIYHVMRAQQCLLMGDVQKALTHCESAAPLIYMVGTQGLLPWPEFVFAKAMARCGSERIDDEAWRNDLDDMIGQLRVWSDQCPENFRHKYLLVAAERARLDGLKFEAVELLDQAARAAHESGFVQWEGLANEKTAQFWGFLGNGRLQQVYWQRAFDAYECWGATAKLESMSAEFRESLAEFISSDDLQDCESGSHVPPAKQRFLDRQDELLGERIESLAQARETVAELEAAKELASATYSLRTDLATRREAAIELRAQRDAEEALAKELDRRVKQRTSDLERTTNELRQSENRFRACFEAAPVGMVMVNQNGQITLSNSALNKLFGYSRDELIGRPIEILVPERFRSAHPGHRDTFFRNPQHRPMGLGRDLFGLHQDGTEIPVELGLTPIDTNEGVGALGTVLDLTARLKAERRIRESEERLRLIIDGAQDYAILMLDTEGRVTSWNSGAERITGYRADEIVGKHFSCFHPSDVAHSARFEEELRLAAVRGRFEDEGWRVRKNGSRYWANVVITALRDERGELIGFSKITRDLSERKKAEDDLRSMNDSLSSSRAILRTIMDESLNFIGVMTTDGTLVDGNRTALDVAGVDAEEVLNRPFVETPWWQHSEELQYRLKESIARAAEGEADSFEATHLNHDGQVIHVDFSLKPVKDESGNVVYLIPEGRDITSHKQREAKLQRLIEEVATSNKELEQFAYVASHDLQEPLRKIASFCQLVKEEQSHKLDDDGIEYLDIAIDGARRLQLLVKDLLSFSRITTHGKPPVSISASKCLQEAFENLQMVIEERGAILTTDQLPDVIADPSQLTLVFQNLIGNAIKYCREPVPTIHVGVRDRGSQYEFFVRDNGIGIDRQFFDRVFEIFQRLHNRREYSGTGIGLALCKRVVERCGGEIWVDSTPNAGSTFCFTLNRVHNQVGDDVHRTSAEPLGTSD